MQSFWYKCTPVLSTPRDIVVVVVVVTALTLLGLSTIELDTILLLLVKISFNVYIQL